TNVSSAVRSGTSSARSNNTTNSVRRRRFSSAGRCLRWSISHITPTQGLKAFLHALLISGTLLSLSLASNKKIKAQGWKYVALFIRRAQALRYLNKAALGEIVAALERAPRELVSPAGERWKKREELAAKVGKKGQNEEEGEGEVDGLGLRQDEPELQPLLDEIPLMPAAPLLRLKTSTLEFLAQGVRASELRHLSLRRNKISKLLHSYSIRGPSTRRDRPMVTRV
ncbi:hypothetical protein A4X06_0g7735, partial [Tilletia controversa]